MTTTTTTSTDLMASYFVGYLFDKYKGTRHVRRVATWIGFIIKAIEKVAGDTIQRSRTRLVSFEYRGTKFKVAYGHDVGPRGGIKIVEVLPFQGSPDGTTVMEITDLAEAEACYNTLQARLDSFVDELSALPRR